MPRKRDRRDADRLGFRLTVWALAFAGLWAVGPAASVARAAGGATRVAVTLTATGAVLSPAAVPAGPVAFTVVNRGSVARDFEFAGKRTPVLAAGKSATLTAEVTAGRTWIYRSKAAGAKTFLGVLVVVVPPCTAPARSTITVRMSEAPMKLSRSTVPCGTVEVVVTNGGKLAHSFHVLEPGGVKDAPGGSGPHLAPGRTVRLTVQFTARGRALYYCGEPEHTETYGESGYLVVG